MLYHLSYCPQLEKTMQSPKTASADNAKDDRIISMIVCYASSYACEEDNGLSDRRTREAAEMLFKEITGRKPTREQLKRMM